MSKYNAPGVYMEEVPSSIKAITGVGTSIAGFIGEAADDVVMPQLPGKDETYQPAKANEAVKITSWEQFKNNFGDIQEKNLYLAHAVYGFFNNGGTVCYVIRIVDGITYRDALQKFEKIDEIAIVAMPGDTISETDYNDLLDHCENLGDRFAIIDGKKLNPNGVLSVDNIKPVNRRSIGGYAALYFPWLKVSDGRGGTLAVPPSGHIAGVYARSDAQRGVHKVPANEVIRGVIGLDRYLSKEDNGSLNTQCINVIREFNGNITIWGGRSWVDLSKESDLKYISTRRLLNYIKESIEEGTKWTVFEPNDISLWAKIRRNVGAFLTGVWRDGGLFGATPEQAFYVKCDAELNDATARELGQVIVEIGIAVTKPAEFVVFRISQWQES